MKWTADIDYPRTAFSGVIRKSIIISKRFEELDGKRFKTKDERNEYDVVHSELDYILGDDPRTGQPLANICPSDEATFVYRMKRTGYLRICKAVFDLWAFFNGSISKFVMPFDCDRDKMAIIVKWINKAARTHYGKQVVVTESIVDGTVYSVERIDRRETTNPMPLRGMG